jgi:hypothetical protein
MMVWELVHFDRPWTVNSERGRGGNAGHWSKTADQTRTWRSAFHVLTMQAKIPPLNSAFITVKQTTKTKTRPDPGSIYPAVKAAIDGIVDAKVLPNDGPDWVEGLLFVPAYKTGVDSVTLLVQGVPR